MRRDRCTVSRAEVTAVCECLAKTYPASRLGNKRNPLDEYLFILLSLRTHEGGYTRAYRSFKHTFRSWLDVDKASVGKIAAAIRVGGLADQKAQRIKRAIGVIKDVLGELSLRKLRSYDPDDAEMFLCMLPGIGVKCARCIMMYSLGMRVLPVDTHVWRISRRLGWLDDGCTAIEAHSALARLVPERKHFRFHVTCVQHGRVCCRGQYPRCSTCCLLRYCRRVGVRG